MPNETIRAARSTPLPARLVYKGSKRKLFPKRETRPTPGRIDMRAGDTVFVARGQSHESQPARARLILVRVVMG
jgi:hypothetical protein